jgi:hypothetical protein
VKSYPTTGSAGSDSPFAQTPSEGQRGGLLSAEQHEYVDSVPASRAKAAADPRLNGRRSA